jgi:hypothetical protein
LDINGPVGIVEEDVDGGVAGARHLLEGAIVDKLV